MPVRYRVLIFKRALMMMIVCMHSPVQAVYISGFSGSTVKLTVEGNRSEWNFPIRVLDVLNLYIHICSFALENPWLVHGWSLLLIFSNHDVLNSYIRLYMQANSWPASCQSKIDRVYNLLHFLPFHTVQFLKMNDRNGNEIFSDKW